MHRRLTAVIHVGVGVGVGLGLVLAASLLACGDSSITACDNEPDVTGAWQLTLGPAPLDAGADASLAETISAEAALEQAGATDFLGIGHYVYGTVTAADARYFGTLEIPRLVKNDGSKTGAVLGCELRINVPITVTVSDDNVDQGPLRLALVGKILTPGVLTGLPGSHLTMANDATLTPLAFFWTASRATP